MGPGFVTSVLQLCPGRSWAVTQRPLHHVMQARPLFTLPKLFLNTFNAFAEVCQGTSGAQRSLNTFHYIPRLPIATYFSPCTAWWKLRQSLTCTQQQGCASRTESSPRSPAPYPWSRRERWFPGGNFHRACEKHGAKRWKQVTHPPDKTHNKNLQPAVVFKFPFHCVLINSSFTQPKSTVNTKGQKCISELEDSRWCPLRKFIYRRFLTPAAEINWIIGKKFLISPCWELTTGFLGHKHRSRTTRGYWTQHRDLCRYEYIG